MQLWVSRMNRLANGWILKRQVNERQTGSEFRIVIPLVLLKITLTRMTLILSTVMKYEVILKLS